MYSALSTPLEPSLLPHLLLSLYFLFFFNDTATTEIYTLSLHDALPISRARCVHGDPGPVRLALGARRRPAYRAHGRSEEHTSELQSLTNLVCRLLLEKKKKKQKLNVASK